MLERNYRSQVIWLAATERSDVLPPKWDLTILEKVTHSRMLRKLNNQRALTDDDRAAISNLPVTLREVQPPGYIVRDGDTPSRCAFLVEGFTFRQKITRDGSRQIVSVQVPGDFIDLQHLLLRQADHNVQALSVAVIAEVPIPALADVMRNHFNIAEALWIDALIEASIFREWMVNVGRRDARTRLAHLLCEFSVRLHAVGLAEDGAYEIPMTQEQLSDALGLTPVHINRVMRALENDGLIVRNKRRVTVNNWEKLRRAADFGAHYLHLDQMGLGLPIKHPPGELSPPLQ